MQPIFACVSGFLSVGGQEQQKKGAAESDHRVALSCLLGPSKRRKVPELQAKRVFQPY